MAVYTAASPLYYDPITAHYLPCSTDILGLESLQFSMRREIKMFSNKGIKCMGKQINKHKNKSQMNIRNRLSMEDVTTSYK
jgi:hypothetical protein